jgi:hypothetical protein
MERFALNFKGIKEVLTIMDLSDEKYQEKLKSLEDKLL